MQLFTTLGKTAAKWLKGVFAIAIVASFSIPSLAATDAVNALQVNQKNGDKQVILFADRPLMSFTATDCVVDCTAATYTFPMADIEKITLLDSEVGIESVTETSFSIDLSDSNRIVVNGMTPNAKLSIYNLNGIMVVSAQADANGHADVEISQLPSGSVFIVSIHPDKTFKLFKK